MWCHLISLCKQASCGEPVGLLYSRKPMERACNRSTIFALILPCSFLASIGISLELSKTMANYILMRDRIPNIRPVFSARLVDRNIRICFKQKKWYLVKTFSYWNVILQLWISFQSCNIQKLITCTHKNSTVKESDASSTFSTLIYYIFLLFSWRI